MLRKKRSGYGVKTTVRCILPVHLLLTKFAQCVCAYFSTATQTDTSHINIFILSSTPLNHILACNPVVQLAH